MNESIPLLHSKNSTYSTSKSSSLDSSSESNVKKKKGLSMFFTILCIIDLFGVFPVIVLPKVVITCGLYGIGIVLFVFSLQIYTAILLSRCWLIAEKINPSITHKNRYPYAALAEMAFGKYMSNFVTILLDITVFGSGIPNLLVASQNLQLFGLKMSNYTFEFSYCWWLLLIGLFLCPIMWLGSPKDMKALVTMSVIVVTTVTTIISLCIVEDEENPEPTTNFYNVQPSIQDVLMAYGVLAFQFDIHPMLLTIQVDMEDNTKIGKAIIGGFTATATMFSIVTLLGANRYGLDIRSNILQGMPASIPLYFVVLLVTLQLCLSSAVGNSALFQHLEDKMKISRDFSIKRCIIRTSIVAVAVFLGATVPRFDLVMGLIGSTLTGPLMFILPPLFYSKMIIMRNKQRMETSKVSDSTCACSHPDECSCMKKINGLRKITTPVNTSTIYTSYERAKMKFDFLLSFLTMSLGIFATCIATFYSWRDAMNYAQFIPPCIANMTAATLLIQV